MYVFKQSAFICFDRAITAICICKEYIYSVPIVTY